MGSAMPRETQTAGVLIETGLKEKFPDGCFGSSERARHLGTMHIWCELFDQLAREHFTSQPAEIDALSFATQLSVQLERWQPNKKRKSSNRASVNEDFPTDASKITVPDVEELTTFVQRINDIVEPLLATPPAVPAIRPRAEDPEACPELPAGTRTDVIRAMRLVAALLCLDPAHHESAVEGSFLSLVSGPDSITSQSALPPRAESLFERTFPGVFARPIVEPIRF